ncbi:hypothetical protein Poly51_07330 [Rubripirellula tenax]|uniref:Uncharacterized protein n=1 Tax=Rubripirellula tenax TaxID=2528015 RepID=A0A5C6FKC3_9BACT|nr:hypothetical protein Poly51_07330 [Rubripirellula tenax]
MGMVQFGAYNVCAPHAALCFYLDCEYDEYPDRIATWRPDLLTVRHLCTQMLLIDNPVMRGINTIDVVPNENCSIHANFGNCNDCLTSRRMPQIDKVCPESRSMT